jgi:phosphosulfolactate phosphohydrolase-like enzyme
MKKIDVLIAGFLLTPLGAHAQSCEAIKDKDKANYCRATTTNDKSFCQKIGSSDTLNLCMAKLENDIKYCRRIATEKIKKRCENSILR